jgi:hypothetical protein
MDISTSPPPHKRCACTWMISALMGILLPSAGMAQESVSSDEVQVDSTETESVNEAVIAEEPVTESVAVPISAHVAMPAVEPVVEVEERNTSTVSNPVAGFDGGFFIQDPDKRFRLRIKGRVQGRFTHGSSESYVEDADNVRDYNYAFSIPRARLRMDGHAFSPNLKYVMQVEFGGGYTYLRDYYVDIALASRKLGLRVGQYKRPFSRQQLTSSGNQELVDRAITDRAFGAGRDLGIMLHGKAPMVEWALGLFNGSGERGDFSGTVTVDPDTMTGSVSRGRFGNVPGRFKPMAVGRIGIHHHDLTGYSEADLEGGKLRLGFATSVKAAFDADESDASFVRAQADYILKVHGFSTTGAFYVGSAQDGDSFADQSYDRIGFHIQAGHVIAERIQPAVRYALVDPVGTHNRVQELMGGLSVYVFSHNVKWQTDGGVQLREHAEGILVDSLIRTQLQFGF